MNAKKIVLFLVVMPIFMFLTALSVDAQVSIRADVNQDNKMTTTDALLILRKSADYPLTALNGMGWHASTTTGDVNCDGEVRLNDAVLSLKKAVGGYSQADLEAMEWCVDATGSSCGSAHLNLCTTQSSCSGANGHWCNGSCQSNSCATSGQTIAGHNVAKESVLRSIPERYINAAKNNLKIAYSHTSHGTHVSFGMWGLPHYKSGDDSLFKIGSGGLDFRDMGNSGMNGCRDLSAGEGCWHNATRSYLKAHSEVNVIMWSWCQIVGHNVPRYLERMENLINDYPNVTFILMTGHDNNWSDGARDQAKLIVDKAKVKHWYVLDYYDIDTHDMNDTYHSRAGDNAGFYRDWQNSHTKGQDWYECRSSLNGSAEPGRHNNQHITCNRKAYAMWWILARIAGWGG